MTYQYNGPTPPWWQPIYYPTMDPSRPPPSGLSTKEIKKIIKFHQELLDDAEKNKNKKKDGDKNKPNDGRPSPFTAVQWMMLMMVTSPFIGLAYVSLFKHLLSTIQ